jgi:phosphatidylserine/phosphatidylglycerophosphate/cardiolipin synthase-like enzyme
MKRLITFLFIGFCLCWPLLSHAQGKPPISVYFSSRGGCTEAIVKELGQATVPVLVQAYSFTSAPIAKALLDAHKRGVKVEVILDKSQRTEKYSSATFLLSILGYTREELLAMKILDVLRPDYRDGVRRKAVARMEAKAQSHATKPR